MFEDANTKAKQATVVSLVDKTDEEREKEAQIEKEKQVRAYACFPVLVKISLLLSFCIVYCMHVYVHFKVCKLFFILIETEGAAALYRHQPEAWIVSCSPRVGGLGWGHQTYEAPPTSTSHVVTAGHQIYLLTRSSINRAHIQEVSLSSSTPFQNFSSIN